MVVKPHFKPSLSDMDFVSNIEETNELFNTLNLVENADPLVDQVYLYIKSKIKSWSLISACERWIRNRMR